MKKIVFNGLFLVLTSKPVGIMRHTYEVLKELDKIVNPGEIEILAPKCSFDASVFTNIRFREIGYYSVNSNNEKFKRIQDLIWKYVVFPCYCFLHRAYSINLGTTWKYYNFDAISIYDCTLELFYQNSIYREELGWSRRIINNQKAKTQTCKFIFTDSKSARADICRIYHVPLEKVEVIPCGWQHFSNLQEDHSVLDQFHLKEGEYFLTLGSRMPHKNIKWISAAAQKHPQYSFVVSGSRQGRTDMRFEGEIPGNMIFTGYLKDEEVKTLMRYCKAFIQPSFYEGFGIPPLEAMSTGADCIVSNAGALPEIYKNSVWYIDPYDYENIDLDEIMSRPKESNDLILNEYSWQKSAKKMYDVLRKRAQ